MKTLVKILVLLALDPVFSLLKACVKEGIEEASAGMYEGLRPLIRVGWALLLALSLFGFGFLLLHVALYLYLPWSFAEKALLFLILGGVYLISSIVPTAWLYAHSRRQIKS